MSSVVEATAERKEGSSDPGPRPHRGTSILILGILGLAVAWCPFAGWMVSGYAMEMAKEDIRAMEEGSMSCSGLDMTQSGRMLAHVGSIVSSLVAILAAWLLFRFFTQR